MNDESSTNSQMEPEDETPIEDVRESDEEAPLSASTEELFKEIGNKDAVRIVAELLQGRQIASIYIDARSGGVFFGSGAHIAGDVIGRSQIKQAATSLSAACSEMVAGRVLAEDLSKTSTVYVKPAPYDHAWQILNGKHVLILWGQAHRGKWTTAIHLLASLHTDSILAVRPDVDLDELRSIEVESGYGYVIDTLASGSAERLGGPFLAELGKHFGETDGHLVITIDDRASLSREALGDFLITWSDLPDPDQVLEKHLAWYLPDKATFTKALQVSQDDAVGQTLSARLLPGEVDRLAELLATVAQGELSLEDALARFEAHARERVKEWFEAHTRLEERTFMLSLAVLSHASYQDVVDADERLQMLIKPSSESGDASLGADAVFSTRSQKVKEACGYLVQGHEDTEFGRSPVELIVLENPTFQPAVLNYAWNEYDRLRKPLVSWLKDLGFHSNFDVRARAAAAVGELSKYDFGYIRREILLPWANHDSERARTAAALALGIPIWEGEYAPQVLGLLHHWSTLRSNWRLSWTATAAYGGLAGLCFPDLALRDLHSIAVTEDLRLLGVLSKSITSLFQAGQLTPSYYLKVLDALVAWTARPRVETVTLTGLLTFLQLAQKARGQADRRGQAWPTLLWLAQEDETCRERVASLWRRALNTKPSRRLALEALRQWLRTAHSNDQLYTPLERFIVTLAIQGTNRERERLKYYLNRWASRSEAESEPAAKILDALNTS
jgi:hypothetical protein